MSKRTCSISGCGKLEHCRTWCRAHYSCWLRHGDPEYKRPQAADFPCQIADCGAPGHARGWCVSHYERWRNHGDPLGGRTSPWRGKPCKIEGCSEPVRARGWCTTHYGRWKTYGDPLTTLRRQSWRGTTCKIDNCGNPARSLGWCKRHYQKWYHTGDALTPDKRTRRGAPIRERIESRIIRTSHCWFWTGYVNRDGYGVIGVVTETGRKTRLAHRVSYEEFVGPIPAGLVLDHRCRNRACVRSDHLEPVTHEVNVRRGASTERGTHCGNGHEFTRENTRWVRVCVTCSDAARERWKARKAA